MESTEDDGVEEPHIDPTVVLERALSQRTFPFPRQNPLLIPEVS